jgi:hypothetical protein
MKNIYVFVSLTNGQVTIEESEKPLHKDDVLRKAYAFQPSGLTYSLHLESESNITMEHMKIRAGEKKPDE